MNYEITNYTHKIINRFQKKQDHDLYLQNKKHKIILSKSLILFTENKIDSKKNRIAIFI